MGKRKKKRKMMKRKKRMKMYSKWLCLEAENIVFVMGNAKKLKEMV